MAVQTAAHSPAVPSARMPVWRGSKWARVRISQRPVWSSQPRNPMNPGLRTGGPVGRRRNAGARTIDVRLRLPRAFSIARGYGVDVPSGLQLAPERPQSKLGDSRVRTTASPGARVDLLRPRHIVFEALAEEPGEVLAPDAQRHLVVQLERPVVEVDGSTEDHAPSTTIVFAWSIVGSYSKI